MTPLVVVIALILVVVVAVNLVGRARAGRRSVRSHHRALDTLGHISHQYESGDNRRRTAAPPPVPRSGRQAHVRVVSADAETLPAPRPMTGGWRPTRATGAAPFRRPPTERHDLWDDPLSAPQTSDAGSVAPVSISSPVDQVRIVARADETDGASADPGSSTDAALPPEPEARVDSGAPGEHPATLDPDDQEGRDPVTAPTPAVPDTARAHDFDTAPPVPAAGGYPSYTADDGFDTPLAFDDVAPPPEAPTGPVTTHRPRGVPAGMSASTPPRPPRTDLAALASVPAARMGRSHQRRPARRRAGHPRALGAAVVVLLVAVIAVGAVLAVGGHKHHAHVAAPVVHRHSHHTKALVTPTSTTPTTTAAAFRLISSSPGASYYQLTGTQKITVTAKGPCWIEIRHDNADGALVYSETMPAGTVETVTGSVWVRLGNPTAVGVTVGGATVAAPVTAGEPYDLEFE